jgi:cytochrome c oxidase cbb3-type subunit 3
MTSLTLSCRRLVVATVLSLTFLLVGTVLGSRLAEESPAEGRQIFEQRCAGCHGLDGRGGERAPDIATNAKTQRRSDDELFRIVEKGVPGTGMPSFASLGSSTKNVVTYLRFLQGKTGAAKLPGDTQKGKMLFYGKARCSECHATAGAGGFIAADLSGFGGTRAADEIREAIVKPSSASRLGGKMIVKTRNGQEYSGVLRNEDNFSLQLQSLNGDFHLFQKSELASFARQPDSLMPGDYGSTLNPSELNDLVSFLMSAAHDVKAEAAAGKKSKGDDEDE